jgi:hypothetical protein
MAVDLQHEYSDKQVLSIASGANTVSTNVDYNAASPKDAFGVAKALEIGGSWFTVEVTTTLVGATVLTAELMTKAANATLSSGGTSIAKIDLPATTAAGTVYAIQIAPGTERLAYLGAVYTSTGANLTGGAVNCRIGTLGARTD